MKPFRICLLVFLIFISNKVCLGQDDLKVTISNSKYAGAKISYNRISESQIKLSLTDNSGNPVKDLKKEDIEIFENDYEAEVIKVVPLSQATGTKINVTLILDNSSSMTRYSDDLLEILDSLVSSFSNLTGFSVVTFNETENENKRFRQYKDKINLNVELMKIDKNINKVKEYYKKRYESGNVSLRTYLRNQIYAAFHNKIEQNDNVENFFIIFSDGWDIGSDVTVEEALAEYKGGKVYIIDFDKMNEKNPFLARVEVATKAEYYKPNDAIQLANYFKTVGERIIFSGYEVTFESNVPPAFLNTNVFEFKNNQFVKFDQVKIEEVKAKEFFPLLNYVFFDEDSSKLAAKYKVLPGEEVSKFGEQNIPADQMSVYYNIMNITGFRMKNSNSGLTLTGCNSNSENEKGNTVLSKARAASVKEYLQNVWGIDPARIKITARNLPEKSSTKSLDEGKAENRRVEMTSDDQSLFDAVELNHFTYLVEPNALQLKPQIKSRYKIKDWTLSIKQEDNIIYEKKNEGILPEVIRLNLAQNLDLKKLNKSNLTVELSAVNTRDIKSIPFIEKYNLDFKSVEAAGYDSLTQKKIEKVSLVLFEFNTSELGKKNQIVLEKVKNSFAAAGEIDIKGYTDNIGTDAYNLKLSEQRAKNLNKAIVKSYELKIPVNVEGLGEMSPLYDNQIPEGRFYNRTCQMIIELQ